MLFVMVFDEAVVMPPSYLGPELQSILKAKLIEKVEGSCTEKYGYIVCVLKVEEISTGKIMDTSGDVLSNTYVSTQQNEKLAMDVEVRFRVLGTKFDSNKITGTGIMSEDYLGPFRT